MENSMDRVMSNWGCTDCNIKPEVLVLYGVVAILLTVIVNWILATLLFMLKPFTCAAILFAFIRPDIVQNFVQDDFFVGGAQKAKAFIAKALAYLMALADQYSRHR